jgi:outer membrane lipoprotein-sorting protein
MKKSSFILLFIFLSVQLIFLSGCRKKIIGPNSTTMYLKELSSYSCGVDIKIKNNRDIYTYSTNQIYSKEFGTRIELGNDRVYIYLDEKIYVTDLKNNLKYLMDKNVDGIYRLSIIQEYINLLYTNENIKYNYKNIDGQECQTIELIIPGNNRNMSKAILYVNMKTKLPHKLYIYDSKEQERVEIVYNEFKPNIEIDKGLFEVK